MIGATAVCIPSCKTVAPHTHCNAHPKDPAHTLSLAFVLQALYYLWLQVAADCIGFVPTLTSTKPITRQTHRSACGKDVTMR